MGIPHDHLESPVPQQLCDGTQINPGHNQSTCKSMAVAMPRISLDLRFFERAGKPAARTLKRLGASMGRENWC